MPVEIELQNPAFTRLVLPVLRAIGWLAMLVLGPVQVTGRYRVPREGGVLVMSNHIADLDPVVVQMACPREIYFMAKSELFAMGFLSRVIRFFRAFPVKRGEPDRDAMKTAAAYLKAGKVVCVFPEGQLSESGELQELKAGVALIVRMAQCPVICVGLQHSNRVMPYGSVIPRPAWRRVRATWGELHQFPPDASAEEIVSWCRAQLLALTSP